MFRKRHPYFNLWFLIPVLCWAIVGGISLLHFSKTELFATFNQHHDTFFDYLVYGITLLGTGGGITAILLSILLAVKSCRNWWFFTAAVICNGLPALLVQWIKNIFHAPRPLKYFHEAAWLHILPGWPHLYSNSFPSGHSAGMFSLGCFLSLLLPERNRPYGLLLFFAALLVGFSRMYVAAHFFLDVYTGSMVGTAATLICFAGVQLVTKRIRQRRAQQSMVA